MKILFYMTFYPAYGGIETVTSIVIQKLKELMGSDIDISILSHLSSENPLCYVNDVSLYHMPDRVSGYTKDNYKYAESVISNGDFDAIIYQDSYAPNEKIVCKLALKFEIPLYVFEHNSPLFIFNKRSLNPLTTPKGFLRRILHPLLLYREKKRKRYLLRCCKKYILLSKRYVFEFCKLIDCDYNDDKLTYINNPIIPNKIEAEPDKQEIILTVSRLVKEKGIDKMLSVWQRLSTLMPNWKFVIVGDGTEREILEHIVDQYNIKNVEFIGYSNPLMYYRQASIFWMTSKFEGWPMTLLESMQQGCVPIVFNSFSAISDIVDDKVNGIMVRNGDLGAFAESTLWIANDSGLLKNMSEEAIKKVKMFEIDKIVKSWQNLLGIIDCKCR